MKSKLVTPGTLFIAALVAVVLAITMATRHRETVPRLGIEGTGLLRTDLLNEDRPIRIDRAVFWQGT